jgi:hypothetical protein
MLTMTESSSQPDDPTDVTFVRGNGRLTRMLAKPGMQEAVDARRRADCPAAENKPSASSDEKLSTDGNDPPPGLCCAECNATYPEGAVHESCAEARIRAESVPFASDPSDIQDDIHQMLDSDHEQAYCYHCGRLLADPDESHSDHADQPAKNDPS